MKILRNGKYAHWWTNQKGEIIDGGKWAIQDKEGIWWLIGGSEFPEKKINRKKTMNCGLPPTFDFRKALWKIVLMALFGVSLAFNLAVLITYFLK